MKLGYFKIKKTECKTLEAQFKQVGENTGNLIFEYALDRLLAPQALPYDFYNFPDTGQISKIILTDLIWIRPTSDFAYLENILKQINQPLIPMSIGLQCKSFDPNFVIPKETLTLLEELEERAVLGVRGEYTAFILEKHGIHNFRVIGCPSMYYWNNPNLKISEYTPQNQSALCNFRTIYGILSQKERQFLSYCATRSLDFVEQTEFELDLDHVSQDKVYYSHIKAWLEKHKKIFFSVSDWCSFLSGSTFSFGPRFHGNVIALWNHMKALFFTIDSRTKELTRHFDLPTLDLQYFDERRPLEFYYELADYTAFNRNYQKRFEEFQLFLQENGLSISPDAVPLQFGEAEQKNNPFHS